MLIGLTQLRGKLLFIGRINGITFDGNVGKGLAPSLQSYRTASHSTNHKPGKQDLGFLSAALGR